MQNFVVTFHFRKLDDLTDNNKTHIDIRITSVKLLIMIYFFLLPGRYRFGPPLVTLSLFMFLCVLTMKSLSDQTISSHRKRIGNLSENFINVNYQQL